MLREKLWRASRVARVGPLLLVMGLLAALAGGPVVGSAAAVPIGLSGAFAVTGRPNILVIMTDDQDVDSLPVMRNLMARPEGSWVKFNNAFASDSLCCPSRATFFSGQYSHHTGVINNNVGWKLDDTNLLPVWLHNAGYKTGLIGKYLNNFPWDRGATYVPPGWDTFNIQGAGNPDGAVKSTLNFLDATNATQPFFFFVGLSDPHQPAEPLARYATASAYVAPNSPNFNEADISDKVGATRNLPPLDQPTIDAWATERLNSQRALLGVDDAIVSIINGLKTRGMLDNTMVIFTTDHGFSWGSHRWIGKHCFFEECSRIPLFIRFPGLVANRDEDRLVSNIDFAATLAEYAGIAPNLTQDGVSFLPLLNGTVGNWSEDVLLERGGDLFGIRVPGWMYAEYPGGPIELYDLTNDPYELQNVAGDPAYSDRRAVLADRLHTLRGPVSPAPPSNPGPPIITFANVTSGALVGGTRSLRVKVSDTEAGVQKVEVLVDDVAVGNTMVSPFVVSWNTRTSADGPHKLAARVYDFAGGIFTSDPLTVTVDNTVPTVVIDSPARNTTLSGSTLISATVTDASAIKSVRFVVDGVVLQTSIASPYQYTLDTTTLANGSHMLRVNATDMAGNSSGNGFPFIVQN